MFDPGEGNAVGEQVAKTDRGEVAKLALPPAVFGAKIDEVVPDRKDDRDAGQADRQRRSVGKASLRAQPMERADVQRDADDAADAKPKDP